MSDRPDLAHILDAVRFHIETSVLPVIRADQRLYFQTLVALNLLRIAQRELAGGAETYRAEWLAYNKLTGSLESAPEVETELAEAVRTRRRILSAEIRGGGYDDPTRAQRLAEFLDATVAAQLVLNNPGLAKRLNDELISGVVPK